MQRQRTAHLYQSNNCNCNPCAAFLSTTVRLCPKETSPISSHTNVKANSSMLSVDLHCLHTSASQARAARKAPAPFSRRLNPSRTVARSRKSGQQTASTAAPPTVKRLILLRHADSEVTSKVRDHDRPISEAGKLQAASIAELLSKQGWVPDLVIASNSKRTKQTLDEMAEVITQLGDVDAHYYGSLYTIAALDGQTREHICECLLDVVDESKTSCILCIGHNKGWEEAASAFAGQVVKLQTASAALLQCAAPSWQELLGGVEGAQWQLMGVLSPHVPAAAAASNEP